MSKQLKNSFISQEFRVNKKDENHTEIPKTEIISEGRHDGITKRLKSKEKIELEEKLLSLSQQLNEHLISESSKGDDNYFEITKCRNSIKETKKNYK